MNINFIIQHINPNLIPGFDPLNPPPTVSEDRFSYDPVHPDALDIIEKLKNCTKESEVRRVIWESFRDSFMDDIAGDYDPEEYRENIFDTWKYYCR